jgi:hypothetical protein
VEISSGPRSHDTAHLPGQQCLQLLVRDRREGPDRLDAGGDEPRLRSWPDAGQHANRKRGEERRLAAGANDGQAAGLAAVRRDLGDDLRARDPERARELRAGADDRLNRLAERAGVVEVGRELAEVEVPLVDPRLLDRRHDPADDRPDLLRVAPVESHSRPEKERPRAASQRLGTRHGRGDPVPARRVVRRGDDASPVRVAAHDDRPPA